MKEQKVVIIGAGFGGLASAAIFAKAGYKVTLVEKNSKPGGRANLLERDGFRFDMGPSWYLMPEIFEHFFTIMGEKSSDYYTLERLSPSYRVFFKDVDNNKVDIFGDIERDLKTLEKLEPGIESSFRKYLSRATLQYEISKDRFLYKNYDSIFDFLTWEVMRDGLRLSVFSRMQNYVARFFKTDEVQKIMQYSLVFLGSSPYNTPALYSLMSHIDFMQGVFYPKGGMYEVVKAIESIGRKNGAEYRYKAPVKEIVVDNGLAKGVLLENGEFIEADIVISNADSAHTELNLLSKESREHSSEYYESRTWAPSALLLYMGVNKKLTKLQHHSLIFCKDWEKNFAQIFDNPEWPQDPSLYVCVPSKTDTTVAPNGKENIFVLVPVAAGLDYTEQELHAYGEKIISTIEDVTGESFSKDILFKEFFSVKDFASVYNSYKGTALGLAHTLKQTALFRPNNISKKVKGLYFVGAGTNPGIGMPMCLISAELVFKRVKEIKTSHPLNSEDIA